MSKTIYYNQLTKRQQKEILYQLIKHSYYSEHNEEMQQFTDIIMPNGDIVKFRFYHDLLPSLYYIPELLHNISYKNMTSEIFNVDFSKLPLNEKDISDLFVDDIINARIVPVSYPKTREESLAIIKQWFPEDRLYTRLESEYKNFYNLDEDSLEFKYFIAEHRAGLSILEKNILFNYREINRKIILDDRIISLDNSLSKYPLIMKEKVRYNVGMDFTTNLNKTKVKILREVMKLLLPIEIEKVTDKLYRKVFVRRPEDKKHSNKLADYIHMLGDEIYKNYNVDHEDYVSEDEGEEINFISENLNPTDSDYFNNTEDSYDNDEDVIEFNFDKVTPIIFKPEEEQDIDYYSLNLEEDDSKYIDED